MNNISKPNTGSQRLTSVHDFYFEEPLYKEFKVSDINGDVMSGDVDGVNPYKGYDTTYYIISTNLINFVRFGTYGGSAVVDGTNEHYYFIKLSCKRSSEDYLYFFIYCDDKKIIKIGQYPSLVDIQFKEMDKKYKKVLDKDSLLAFKRAIGLAAHGIGAGSLVYLRRIFEGLIKESYEQHKAQFSIEEAEFMKKHMNEKVEFLKEYLPTELIKMKPLYGVLSKGVHELAEDECLNYFPALRLSIELILDCKIEEEAKSKRAKDVERQLQAVQSQIGKK